MSVLRTSDDGVDDLLNAMFGSATPSSSTTASTTNAAGVKSGVTNVKIQQEMAKQPSLGLSGPSKKDANKDSNAKIDYVSKADQMEEGRMSSKVIRTQLVKGEKAANQQKKFEHAERIRLEALLGKQAQDKMKKRKFGQLDSMSSDDGDDSEVEPTSKLALVKMTMAKAEAKLAEKKLANGGKADGSAGMALGNSAASVENVNNGNDDTTTTTTTTTTTATAGTSKKNKNKRQKLNAHQQLEEMRKRQEAEDELDELEAD